MVPLSAIRRIEVWFDNTWVQIHLAQITENDIVRQYEPDGTPVLVHGCHEVLVSCRPSMVVRGVPQSDHPDCDELTSDGKINGVYVDQPVPLGMVRRALNGDDADLKAFFALLGANRSAASIWRAE